MKRKYFNQTLQPKTIVTDLDKHSLIKLSASVITKGFPGYQVYEPPYIIRLF